MKFRPDEPMHHRYAVVARLPRRRRWARGGHHRPDRQRVLPLGVQLLRDARARRRGLPDRLRQRLPRRGGHLAALLLPVGDDGAGAVVGVLPGHRAQGAHPGRRRPVVRGRRRRRPGLPGQARGVPALWPTSTSTPTRYQEFCAQSLPHIDEMVLDWVQSRRLRRDAGRAPWPRPTRPTSTSSSSRTSGACSTSGSTTRAPVSAPDPARADPDPARRTPHRPGPTGPDPAQRPTSCRLLGVRGAAAPEFADSPARSGSERWAGWSETWV